MGTRGTFGFFYKGKYYVCYNHFDSYPEGLGVRLILEILQGDLEEWIELLKNIVIVDEEVKPTQEQIEKLKKYTSLRVNRQSTDDWYCLLHKTQGSFCNVLDSGYLMNFIDEDGNPDYQEYSYIVNFDNGTFDLWGTFNNDGEEDGEEDGKVSVPLDTSKLYTLAKKWRKNLADNYDPQKELEKIIEREKKVQEHLEETFKKYNS